MKKHSTGLSSKFRSGARFIGVLAFLFGAISTVMAIETSSRYLILTYTCYVTNIPVSARELDWWVPVPISNHRQSVEIVSADLKNGKLTTEPRYGNRMFYRHITLEGLKSTDTLTLTFTYRVRVDEKAVLQAGQLTPLPKVEASPALQVYLKGNKLIPLEGPVARLREQLQLPAEPILAARQVYDYLINTMVYNYQAPGAGKGDVIWACNSHTGDCSDFHSIFIGVCRSSGIPADHIFGLPLKTKQGRGEAKDWHCWASFWVNGPGWITIDASEASKHPELRNYNFGTLSNNYLTLTHGRDVVLQPAQKGEPLNIFADPYVELDGRHFENVKWLASFQEEN